MFITFAFSSALGFVVSAKKSEICLFLFRWLDQAGALTFQRLQLRSEMDSPTRLSHVLDTSREGIRGRWGQKSDWCKAEEGCDKRLAFFYWLKPFFHLDCCNFVCCVPVVPKIKSPLIFCDSVKSHKYITPFRAVEEYMITYKCVFLSWISSSCGDIQSFSLCWFAVSWNSSPSISVEVRTRTKRGFSSTTAMTLKPCKLCWVFKLFRITSSLSNTGSIFLVYVRDI